jgi:photosystem II stability/assembly factor-like uncharacterized protein
METILYVATSNGVFTFLKEAKTQGWKSVSYDLRDIDVKCLTVDPSDKSVVYAGASDGTVYRFDKGSNWRKVSKLDGKVYCFATTLMDENACVYAGIEPAKLFLSLDGCKSWHELRALQAAPHAAEWYSPWGPADLSTIAFNPRDIRGIYVGIEVGGVLKSNDEGANWKEVNTGLHKDVHCLAINYYNPKIIFAATGRGIYRTVSGGELWVDVGSNIDLKYAVSVAIHPAKPNITYLGMAMGPPGNQALLYKSEDYGETWNLLHNGLSYPMLKGIRRRALVVNPAAPAEVYVGTSDGIVFFSSSEGMKWESIANTEGTINALSCVSLGVV